MQLSKIISFEGWIALIGIPFLFLCAYLLGYFPLSGTINLCAVKAFLNIDCPGCGLTRSFVFLTHGSIKNSILMHPMGIVIAVYFVYIFIRVLLEAIFKLKLPMLLKQKQRDILLFAFILGMFIQWIVKLYTVYRL